MSITVTLPELSPELEKQLAAMSEEERGQFVAAALEEDPDDPAALAYSPPRTGPKILSPEAARRILDAMQGPPQPVTEAMKQAVQNYKRLVRTDANEPSATNK